MTRRTLLALPLALFGQDCAQPGFVLSSGPVLGGVRDDELGYCEVGGIMLSTPTPTIPAWLRVREMLGKPVELVLRPVKTLERLDRAPRPE